MSPEQVLSLQATAGNRAVGRLIAPRAPRTAILQRVTSGATLAQDKAIAKTLIDPLLGHYFVGQDLATGARFDRVKRRKELLEECLAAATELQDGLWVAMDARLADEEQEHDQRVKPLTDAYQEGATISQSVDAPWKTKSKDFTKLLEYWKAKAQRVVAAGRKTVGGQVPLWCDQATAIVVSTLEPRQDFRSSLSILRQGDPSQQGGHWYVLANREGDLTFGRGLTPNEFIIDLWGALRLQTASTVFEHGPLNLFQTPGLQAELTIGEKSGLAGPPQPEELVDEFEQLVQGLKASSQAEERKTDSNAETLTTAIADVEKLFSEFDDL